MRSGLEACLELPLVGKRYMSPKCIPNKCVCRGLLIIIASQCEQPLLVEVVVQVMRLFVGGGKVGGHGYGDDRDRGAHTCIYHRLPAICSHALHTGTLRSAQHPLDLRCGKVRPPPVCTAVADVHCPLLPLLVCF